MDVGVEGLTEFFGSVLPLLDERQTRLVTAGVVRMLGRGGQARVAEATGMSRNTLLAGVRELVAGVGPSPRVRRPGAGRPSRVSQDPDLLVVLDSLVEPGSRGDPMSPLRWTVKSIRVLARELSARGHRIGVNLVGELLHYMGYSLQANAKVNEGAQHQDRDAQFHYVNTTAAEFLAAGEPVISVDCKKKELVGNHANSGVEWNPKGTPTRTDVHDFPDPEIGKAIPYGVYDIGDNSGWVNVGDDHDTPAFAVASIARWWERMGKTRYPNATRLMITADAGGSNSYRSRIWKAELAALAATIGVIITVCHMPPGTSKWNKIEHRLFSAITMNWAGQPLTTHHVVVNLIAATTTQTGLTVQADLDQRSYPLGRKISDHDFNKLPVTGHTWHPDWNYTIAHNSSTN